MHLSVTTLVCVTCIRLLSLLLLPAFLLAQTCPPVNFLNINQVNLVSGTAPPSGTALIRQPDGTFSGYRGTGRPPTFTFNSITPNFQNNVYACSPLAGRPHRNVPGRPNFLDTLPGTQGRNPLIVDFLGDSTSLAGFGIDYLSNLTNGVTLAVANTSGSLRSTTTAPSGPSPRHMVTADFNNDGRRDLAILNFANGNGTFAVYLNNGTTTLPNPTLYNTGTSPVGITTADFNSDNRPDIALINSRAGSFDRYLNIYLNNGSGVFGTPTSTLLPGFAIHLLAADFTGDGRIDILAGGAPISVFPGNGDGTFRTPLLTQVPTSPYYIAAGDFNKDGRLDLAGTESTNNAVTIYFNSGSGLFPTRRSYSLGDGNGNSDPHLFATDFDGDSWTDIVVGTGHPDAIGANLYGSTARVLINRGDGSGAFFGAPIFSASGSLLQPALGDFNGDNRIDAISTSNNGISFLAGTGSGFQPAVALPVLSQQNFTARASAVNSGDFNNDGRLDVAVYNGVFTVMLGGGNGSFTQSSARIANASGLDALSLAVGDINGDNRLDLVASQQKNFAPFPNQVLVLLGNGDGTLQNPVPLTTCANPSQVRLADLNGDNRLDLIATCSGAEFTTPPLSGGVAIALGAGNGTFQPPSILPAGSNPTATTVADLTGDNRPDLIVSTNVAGQLGVYKINVFLNQGTGAFQAPIVLETEFGPAGHAVMDANADGTPDILAAHCCGDTNIGLYLGNGGGTFQAERFLSIGEASYLFPADLNADGKLDLIATRSGSDSLTLFFNAAGTLPTEACTFTLSRTAAVAAPSGDALGFIVRPSAPTCTWTASSPDAWLTIANTQRTGGGAILVTVAANPTNALRSSSAIIAGLPVTITQYPTVAGCTYAITPSSFSFNGESFSADYSVQTGNACPWSASTSAPWIFTSANGTGPRSFLALSPSTNSTGSPRAGILTIGNARAQVIQRAFTDSQAFTDVPTTDPFFPHIGLIRDRAITLGCTATTYCPGTAINRGQMAVFLVRTILATEDFSFSATPYFTDVPASHPFFRYIQKLRELNVTSGCTATTYCPDDAVTRGQMAAFLTRGALGVAPGGVFPFPSTAFFTDVPASHPFFSFVQLLRNRGITSGCTATTYCPDAPVTRGQMAVFLVRGLLAE